MQGLGNDNPAFYILNKVFLILAPFCLASGLVDLLYNQVQADIYDRFGINTFLDPFDMEMLGWRLVALVIQGVVAFLLLMLIEYKGRNWFASCFSRSVEKYHGAEDEDVINEKRRVQSGDARRDLVCINNLTKVKHTSVTPTLTQSCFTHTLICVYKALYTHYFPESCEQIPRAYYLGWI